MSSSPLAVSNSRSMVMTRVSDFVELAKPRIAILVLVVVAASALVGGWGSADLWKVLHAMVGTVLVAASASACNQWIERRSDCKMRRTAQRPLPAGRLSETEVLTFALITLVGGLLYLQMLCGFWACFWSAATWVAYVVIYTPLKPVTASNTAIGAIAGALPVFIGWSATSTSNDFLHDWRAPAIFLILYLWQFPHFMAIAWIYREQYGQAGLKMLPVVDPTGRRAGVQAILAAAALIPISILPAFLPTLNHSDAMGTVYLVVVSLLGIIQLVYSVRFFRDTTDITARHLLRMSLVYLPLVMVLLVLMHMGTTWMTMRSL